MLELQQLISMVTQLFLLQQTVHSWLFCLMLQPCLLLIQQQRPQLASVFPGKMDYQTEVHQSLTTLSATTNQLVSGLILQVA
jgi:hypothetical protein